ncbi:hemoglobin [Branchiibius hedensis]|uniref:Hemoglobin n=1 Tax=Branchiibius hedensis TaxID=672460 RepID=A0A2Y8ZP46_9MICO|nr:oxidoreductase [Branchiibius hedensis]PWJ24777.1 hemoglobin [Branchiibius hedensis]SSA33594.1 hemoglobin [Branchiibius hedensis]
MITLYGALGGSATVHALADAWHRRVLADPVVSHAFRRFEPDHTQRLAAYWTQAWGGPADYTATYGSESDLVRMHSGNGEHEEMNRRAIACFDAALSDAGVPEGELRDALHDYFAFMTTGPMYAYHESAADVPDDLTVTRWGLAGRLESQEP